MSSIWFSYYPPSQEMVEALHEKVVHILHTKDGSRVAMQCVWHGTAKVIRKFH